MAYSTRLRLIKAFLWMFVIVLSAAFVFNSINLTPLVNYRWVSIGQDNRAIDSERCLGWTDPETNDR